MRAVATRTGARPRPVTQWTPMQVVGSDRNSLLTKHNQASTISCVGADPSVKLSSDTVTPENHRWCWWGYDGMRRVLFYHSWGAPLSCRAGRWRKPGGTPCAPAAAWCSCPSCHPETSFAQLFWKYWSRLLLWFDHLRFCNVTIVLVFKIEVYQKEDKTSLLSQQCM